MSETVTTHLIVACVKSKYRSGPHLGEVCAGLPQKANPSQIHQAWKDVLNQLDPTDALAADHLYKGAAWKTVLEARANLARDQSQFWIVSCGYGLIPADGKIGGYEATFQVGEASSVQNFLNSTTAATEWWQMMTSDPIPLYESREVPRSFQSLFARFPKDRFFVLLSQTYLEAVKDDLSLACESLQEPEQCLILSNSADARRVGQFAQQGHLLPHVSGAARSLETTQLLVNPKLATKIFQSYSDNGKWSYQNFAKILQAIEPAIATPQHNRLKMTDTEVESFIQANAESHGKTSKTRLHRQLRENGNACEQKRFAKLYDAFWQMRET